MKSALYFKKLYAQDTLLSVHLLSVTKYNNVLSFQLHTYNVHFETMYIKREWFENSVQCMNLR